MAIRPILSPETGGVPVPRRRGPDDSPGILLWRAANAWQRAVRAVVKEHDLSHAQYVLLLGLYDHEERTRADPLPLSQRALAVHCGVDVAMASQVLRQLEAAGHLRRGSGTDARSRAISLTGSGRRLVEELAPLLAAVDARFFAVLGDNAEMFKAALQVLLGLPPRLGAARVAPARVPRSPE